MTIRRNTVTRRTAVLALGSIAAAPAVAQAAYPSRPITIVVPFAPGGNLDIVSRLLVPPMSATLGQSIIVENKPGAGAVLGHQAVAQAAADGYTVLCTSNGSFTFGPKFMPSSPFRTSDFRAIGSIAVSPMVVEVGAASRFHTITDLITYAKANPGQVSVGHAGNATTNHIAILQLEQATGIKFNIIPYKGGAPAISSLLAGEVDAVVDQLSSSSALIHDGKFRALAVTSGQRSSDLPDVPTLAESGLRGFDVSTIAGLLAPAKTPSAVIVTLNKALNAALETDAIKRRFHEFGSQPRRSTPEEFSAFLLREEAKADELVKSGLLKGI